MSTLLRVGTRPSPLALVQAELAASVLRDAARTAGVQISTELVAIRTTGDRIRDRPFSEIGTKGIFTSELQAAVLDGRVDVAVHSAKDLTESEPAGLVIAAVLERADARDVLVSRDGSGLRDLAPGGRVGTSSARRRSQLASLRPDLEVVELRGNVGTRVERVRAGDVDAAVLAAAGLLRLGLGRAIAEWLDPSEFCPSPGQGSIVVEASSGRLADDLSWVASADHPATRTTLRAERVLIAELQGGCALPLGCWARVEDGSLRLDGFVGGPTGTTPVRARADGHPDDPEAAGQALVAALLDAGARPLIDAMRSTGEA